MTTEAFDSVTSKLNDIASHNLRKLTGYLGCYDTMAQVERGYADDVRANRLAFFDTTMSRDLDTVRQSILEGRTMPVISWDRANRCILSHHWESPEVIEELVTLAIKQLNHWWPQVER